MKLEDISRLKQICNENGFEIKSESQSGLLYYIDKKDPWEGVEFGVNKHTRQHFKVSNYKWGLQNCEPSTEVEYVDQLEKESFKRFGDIKEGDRFKNPSGIIIIANPQGWGEFDYFKETDSLSFGGVYIYQSGKWATKLPERVKVSFCWNKDEKHDRVYFNFHKNTGCEYEIGPSLFTDDNPSNIKAIGEFLSKQLENYLNDNQE